MTQKTISVTVKLNPDGNIKLPAQIQTQLGLKTGDEFLIILEGNDIKLQMLKPRKLSEFYGVFPATQSYPGTAEIRQTIAKNLAQEILTGNS